MLRKGSRKKKEEKKKAVEKTCARYKQNEEIDTLIMKRLQIPKRD